LLAALYAPIQDCDEVYNYWEPTHYLTHGYGLQTWEYSPQYSIRSWLYIALHAAIGKLSTYIVSSKTSEFYCIRIALALVCAGSQAKLFTTIAKVLNPRVAIMFMIIMLTSSGMFYASVAYLPSSFAMYCNMLAMSSFLESRAGSGIENGIMWFGIGGLIGWPFAAALIIPFLVEETIMATITEDFVELIRRVMNGAIRCTGLMVC
jgi:alpha-1,2-mannosyltransferase